MGSHGAGLESQEGLVRKASTTTFWLDIFEMPYNPL